MEVWRRLRGIALCGSRRVGEGWYFATRCEHVKPNNYAPSFASFIIGAVIHGLSNDFLYAAYRLDCTFGDGNGQTITCHGTVLFSGSKFQMVNSVL